MEMAPGKPAVQFLAQTNNPPELTRMAAALARTLTLWHSCGIFHGDPHLGNVMVDHSGDEMQINLIDYNMLHYKSFQSCQQKNCFRFPLHLWDLQNDLPIGNGFRQAIATLDKPLAVRQARLSAFDAAYGYSPTA